MARAKRFNEKGDGGTSIELPADLFEQPMHEQAVYETVNAYRSHQRQGTVKTKQRAEVAFSTVKLYRQKGTGRARAGSAKSPVRVGGGTIFGPQPRSWRTNLSRKVRRLALKSALSDRARLDAVRVLENPTLEGPKTKTMVALLDKMGLSGKKILFVTNGERGVLYKSLRNIQGVDTIPAYQLNAYQILRSDILVFTEESLRRTVEVFGS